MSDCQLLRHANIEIKSSGSTRYAERVSIDDLEKFADLVRRDERELMLCNLLRVFRELDSAATNHHHYWRMASQLIQQELESK
jgi:hypothetical protein